MAAPQNEKSARREVGSGPSVGEGVPRESQTQGLGSVPAEHGTSKPEFISGRKGPDGELGVRALLPLCHRLGPEGAQGLGSPIPLPTLKENPVINHPQMIFLLTRHESHCQACIALGVLACPPSSPGVSSQMAQGH